MRIYHILPRTDWEKAQASGDYRADSLAKEGFIHASTAAQVADTANRYYHGVTGLIVLEIDPERVQPDVRFDPVMVNGIEQKFPHIYGPLNLDAVVNAIDFPPESTGSFKFSKENS